VRDKRVSLGREQLTAFRSQRSALGALNANRAAPAPAGLAAKGKAAAAVAAAAAPPLGASQRRASPAAAAPRQPAAAGAAAVGLGGLGAALAASLARAAEQGGSAAPATAASATPLVTSGDAFAEFDVLAAHGGVRPPRLLPRRLRSAAPTPCPAHVCPSPRALLLHARSSTAAALAPRRARSFQRALRSRGPRRPSACPRATSP
jgi:hypothetical protein